MTWQLIRLADAVASPWRNGGGVTRELAAWPAGSADWTWRISVAEVATSGPFSRFEGVQRWFAVLSGNGVSLQMPGAEHRLTAASEPLEFDGAVAVDCRLHRRPHAGPEPDGAAGPRLGADAADCRGAAVRCPQPRRCWPSTREAGAAQLRDELGSLTVPAQSLAWRSVPAGTQVEVTAPGAVWMEIEPWA